MDYRVCLLIFWLLAHRYISWHTLTFNRCISNTDNILVSFINFLMRIMFTVRWIIRTSDFYFTNTFVILALKSRNSYEIHIGLTYLRYTRNVTKIHFGASKKHNIRHCVSPLRAAQLWIIFFVLESFKIYFWGITHVKVEFISLEMYPRWDKNPFWYFQKT